METPGTALIRRFIEQVWNQADFSGIENLIHHDYTVEGTLVGRDWVVQNVASYRRSFPDFRVSIETIVEHGNQVAVLLRLQGTHQATWGGIPATGRTINYREAAFWQIDDGLISSGEFIAEALALRIQLGQISPTIWHGQSDADSG